MEGDALCAVRLLCTPRRLGVSKVDILFVLLLLLLLLLLVHEQTRLFHGRMRALITRWWCLCRTDVANVKV
jgi:hypothetical protein